jgi:UDP-N-acetylmuramoyl-tripeptide--D-alanyl-D-alanine ligase
LKTLNLNEIIKVLGIHGITRDALIKNVSNNISRLGNNTLVFHLNKLDELNESQFNALKDCYIVTDQSLLVGSTVNEKCFLHVLNVQEAYRKFISWYRRLFDVPVVAVTGTCGKTTTKEMIAQVLRHRYKVVATIGNRNALSFDHEYIMSFDDDTDFGVIETGITDPGNLIYGCEFFKPVVGIITTIGIDHLSGCKTMDNYIRTKSEMLAGMEYQGTLIINNDDDNIRKINFNPFRGQIVTFGIKRNADYRARNLAYTNRGMTFVLEHEGKTYPVDIPGFGEHNVYNALAALAALVNLGMDLKESIRHLSEIKHISSHDELKKGIKGSTIIDDTWSSNPTSVEAALKVLHELGKDKKKVAVLGKISYLGDFESKYYEEIAKMIIKYKVDFLVTQDSSAKEIGTKAVELGMDASHVIYCKDNESLKTALEFLLDDKTIALFKSSMLDKSHVSVLRELIVE